MNDVILVPFRLPAWQTALLFAALGGLLTAWLTRRALHDCNEADRGWAAAAALAAAACCGGLAFSMLTWKVQETPNVRPSEIWWHWRIGHHVVLISLMVAATATDLRAYLIPDRLIRFGLVWAVLMAALSGDLQIEQVWVDWNEEIPQLRGPYLPDWLAQYPHLHGAVWSIAGAACGALGTWLIRAVASLALGQEAMGMGDVTLMAMIGAFLGWQATIVALLLAPLCGLVVGAVLMFGRGLQSLVGILIPRLRPAGQVKAYLPFGPFLCLAAFLVLLTWRWIWMFELRLAGTPGGADRLNTFAVRRLFGDWISLLAIAAATLIALVIVLLLRRLYRSLPVRRQDTAASHREAKSSNTPPVASTSIEVLHSDQAGATSPAPPSADGPPAPRI